MTPNMPSSFHFNTSEGFTHQTISAIKLTSAAFLLVTFVFGLVMNTLYLWVLTFRTRRSVNSTWFFHLILGNLLFTLSIPFFTAYVIMKPRWIFGLYMCKIINSVISLDMYVTVFILIVISIDRYCLVFHPIWYRRYMNPKIATVICLLLWFLALLLTSPYFLFRQVKYENNVTICENDYTLSGRWNRQRVKWIMFTTRLFLGLIIPFAVITSCYLKIIIKISKDNMARSNKPYRVICIAIISFFVSWTPYHMWYGMSSDQDRFPESLLNVLQMLTNCFACLNSCFTPVLYLFTVENFKTMFRRSLLDFIELVFNETISSANRSIDEKREQQSLSKEEKT
ncbi:probable G-protein coupled receptor 33 isoform X2 [Hyla sarda]|nr:probable G-protein coupled receptor 33 isoform X2 [Hyla sarda]XP_056398837.1 probable G-protein coupled receptor 33 isoform X2 [Hyla sarda]XP_056398838.1 probable G-protein coupled receptor 33 isoform X2 [Hyla sarda]